MNEQKFTHSEMCDMHNVASVLTERLGLSDLPAVWESIKKFDGTTVNTLEKPVKVHFTKDGVSYDGQEDDGRFEGDIALYPDEFETIATNFPYHPALTVGDLFTICESRSACIGAKCVLPRVIIKMGYNLGQTVISKISLFYGLVYALLK